MKKNVSVLVFLAAFGIHHCSFAQSELTASTALSLRKRQIQENQNDYTLQVEYPELQYWKQSKTQKKINQAIEAAISTQLLEFRNHLQAYRKEFKETPIPGRTNGLWIRYQITQESEKILSMVFEISSYFVGAVHPKQRFATLTFEMKKGKVLTLAKLFPKDTPFLEIISQQVIQTLLKRFPKYQDWILKGAAPQPENYRNFTLSSKGLTLWFNPYQVAPYGAGPQTVVIPYQTLRTVGYQR